MKNEKNLNEEPTALQELADESLDAVTGGGDGDFNYEENNPTPVGSDSQGRITHWKRGNEVYHYECPTCKRLLHAGTAGMLYCDPCGDWFFSGLFGGAVEVKGWY